MYKYKIPMTMKQEAIDLGCMTEPYDPENILALSPISIPQFEPYILKEEGKVKKEKKIVVDLDVTKKSLKAEKICIRLDGDLLALVKKIAKDEETNTSAVVRKLIKMGARVYAGS